MSPIILDRLPYELHTSDILPMMLARRASRRMLHSAPSQGKHLGLPAPTEMCALSSLVYSVDTRHTVCRNLFVSRALATFSVQPSGCLTKHRTLPNA